MSVENNSLSTVIRLIKTLELIPSYPSAISKSTLHQHLSEQGFIISERTLERDLKKLSESNLFGLNCDDSEIPYRWSKTSESMHSLSIPDALSYCIVEPWLKAMLPSVSFSKIEKKIHFAENLLNQISDKNGLSQWRNKIAFCPSGLLLKPAHIDETVWHAVTESIVYSHPIDVEYKNRQDGNIKKLTLHGQGLVVRNSITYLVSLTNSYDDLRVYAVHRIVSATQAQHIPFKKAPNFDLQDYINSGVFGWPTESPSQTILKAEIHPDLAYILSETPISAQQTIKNIPSKKWLYLETLVPNTQETLWWIYAMNQKIKVKAPNIWKEQVLDNLKETSKLYEQ